MAKQAKQEQVQLQKIDIREFEITLEGTSSLLVNAFSEKSKTEMLEKQMKKAKQAKEARDPEKEARAALYLMPKGSKYKYGVPSGGVKNCAVTATRFMDGLPATKMRGAFFIQDDGSGLLPIITPKEPVVDERIVRIGPFGKKTAVVRFRPRFDEWKLKFRVQYNASVVSPEQLVNLFNVAGFGVGLCEFRPEKNGNLGRFQVSH